MAGTESIASRKRAGEDARDRFSKKRRRQQAAYHSSDSEDDDEAAQQATTRAKGAKKGAKNQDKTEPVDENASDDGFQAVDLLDSDEENLNSALVDDGASSDGGADHDGDSSSSDDGNAASFHDSLDSLDSLDDEAAGGGASLRQRRLKKATTGGKKAAGEDEGSDEDDDDDDDDEENDSFDDNDSLAGSAASATAAARSKRNDPSTFATSLHKILGTKLSTTRRADPVLARSAAAREASRRVVDAGLAEKARRQLRLERRAALEKGRVKDVLLATNRPVAEDDDAAGGDAGAAAAGAETAAAVRETERRLRKVAQRGVVRLFNAVRAAQVQAAETQRRTRDEGVRGMDKRAAKVTEMSRKGFLDLIASGGGGLKKDGLEEA